MKQHTIVLLPFYIRSSQASTKDKCSCRHYSNFDEIGPYCSKWNGANSSFCLLSGRSESHVCPGAVKVDNFSLYWSNDKEVCDKSSNFTAQFCNCAHHKKYDFIGPFCTRWLPSLPPFCILEHQSNIRFCPGAEESGNGDGLYFTTHDDVCHKSIYQHPLKFDLRLRDPFNSK